MSNIPLMHIICEDLGIHSHTLKEVEHRKLGWNILILKYDLSKSLSKEMWCKMADTKKYFDYIF